MKQSIYRFKDGGRREYAEFYAKESARLYGDWIKRKDIQAIIPIPIHRHKRYKRGYNQAEVYAKELGKQCGLPVDSKTLIRVVDTLPQKTLSDRERKNNLKKALKIGVDGVQWKRVLVVDDIYTTGSTVDAAAAVLREAGVEKIYILSITIGNGYQNWNGCKKLQGLWKVVQLSARAASLPGMHAKVRREILTGKRLFRG